MKKKVSTVAAVLVLISVVFLGLAVLRGSEDDWICDNGQWVEHGHPLRPKPTGVCSEKLFP